MIASDTTYLALVNKVANHPSIQAHAQGQNAADLIAAAARHVGFALIAVGLAEWGAEPHGRAEMQARVSNQQSDTLSLAPISYAAASAVSCLDACAAAAYRLCVGAPRKNEWDLRKLGSVVLRPNLQTWAQDALADPGYQDMVHVRHRMVHRDIPSTSVVGSAPGHTTYRVGGQDRTPEDATLMFTEIAQRYYKKFITAVLADFP
ncbi:hypothetical protein ACW9HR_32635 [Nocardia gipuzkoensis]